MGGSGSGQYYRWDKKPTVEDGLTLDLCKLIRDGYFKPGQDWQGSLYWSIVSTGERIASIDYKAYMSNLDHCRIELDFKWHDQPHCQTILLTFTRPNFGGRRWWFICPITNKRVAKLYTRQGRPYFASREEHDLRYSSQCENVASRMLEKAYKLRKKLGKPGNVEDPIPAKPIGMHWNTYARISNQIENLENEGWLEALNLFHDRLQI